MTRYYCIIIQGTGIRSSMVDEGVWFVVWLHWIMTHDVWFMGLFGVEGLEYATSACVARID